MEVLHSGLAIQISITKVASDCLREPAAHVYNGVDAMDLGEPKTSSAELLGKGKA